MAERRAKSRKRSFDVAFKLKVVVADESFTCRDLRFTCRVWPVSAANIPSLLLNFIRPRFVFALISRAKLIVTA